MVIRTQPPRLPPLLDFLFYSAKRRAAEKIERRSSDVLRQLVQFVGSEIPFYREHWRSAGVNLAEFRGTPDLPSLPFTDKNLIVGAGAAAIGATAQDEVVVMSTSGTSGRAIHVQRTRIEMRQMRRGLLRYLFCNGLRPWHRVVTFASPWLHTRRGAFIQRFCKTSFIAADADFDAQIKTLQNYAGTGKPAEALIGQTGGIYLLARELLRRGLTIPLRAVAPTGTTVMAEMRRAMREAFQTDPIDLYGAIELGPVAWQCRRGNYHVDIDRVIVEIVDDQGRPLPRGKFGQVVCTALYAAHMPFIRYRLLDISALSTRRCDCGLTLPLMEPIQGRINDFLPTLRGDLVSPHFFFHLFDATGKSPVKEWRLIQPDLRNLVYEYVPEADFDPGAFELGMQRIRDRMGPECALRTQRVDAVPMGATGKRTCIVSMLRPAIVSASQSWVGERLDSALAGDGATYHFNMDVYANAVQAAPVAVAGVNQ
ncbi:MAG: phenylacetate--CoA ligase family protein [Phycisphaerales bacterium]|nr:phenylacetate--CoA ligase family protein [Phycisphaerales bacterium]